MDSRCGKVSPVKLLVVDLSILPVAVGAAGLEPAETEAVLTDVLTLEQASGIHRQYDRDS